jgi:hypothetical protein
MSTLFTDGSTVTFGIGDSPIGTAIIESERIDRNTTVTKIRDANGFPTGKTVVRDFDELTLKLQLTGATGPSIANGYIITLSGDGKSYMVTKASAVYTQGQYAYQDITATIQVASIS